MGEHVKTSNCSSCQDTSCSAKTKKNDENSEEFINRQAIKQNLCKIKNKIIVMSGKGGVGKSSVAVNLATALSLEGKSVGLLDIDIHGPSIPTMMNLKNSPIISNGEKMMPIIFGSMKVMSVGFFLQDNDDALIWRGPMKHGVVEQFIRDVEWGNLDYLIIDSPPGTGDEHLSLIQTIDDMSGAILVTTPQEVAAADVRKSVSFCEKTNLKIIGIIENMSGFVCPHCGEITNIFNSGAGQKIADKYGFELLGKIPIDPSVGESGDAGTPFVYSKQNTKAAEVLSSIAAKVIDKTK